MSIKRLHYAQCQKQNHDLQPLSRICIDQNCENKTLVCCVCQDLQHKGHRTTPLKTFLQKIAGKSEQTNSFNPFYYSNKIQELKFSYFSSINSQRNKIIQIFNDLEIQAQIYFNQVYQMTSSLINMDNLSTIINQQSANPKTIKSYFQKIIKFVDLQSKDGFNLKKQIQFIVDSCKDKQKKLNQAFESIKSEFIKHIQKVTSSLTENSALKSPTFQWSQQLKGHKVKITGILAEQTNMQSSGQRFALIQPGLSQFGKRKQMWGIKVKKFVGWIGLGICLKNSIKKANYHFNYTNVGHGSYLISSNGYSWSHSVKQLNSAFKTFQFTVNDTVYVQYDPETWKLRFRKNQGPQNFQLSIVPPPSDDAYHPCVNLCSTGDSVELILPGFPLS